MLRQKHVGDIYHVSDEKYNYKSDHFAHTNLYIQQNMH